MKNFLRRNRVDNDGLSNGRFNPNRTPSSHNYSDVLPSQDVRYDSTDPSFAEESEVVVEYRRGREHYVAGRGGDPSGHISSEVPQGYNQFSADTSANRRVIGGRWLLNVQQDYTEVNPVANPLVTHASTDPMAFRNMSFAASKEDLRDTVRTAQAEQTPLPAGLYRNPDNQPVWNPKDVVDGALNRVSADRLPSFLDRAAHPLSLMHQAQEGLVQGVPTEAERESLEAVLTYGALAVAQTVEDINLPRPTQE